MKAHKATVKSTTDLSDLQRWMQGVLLNPSLTSQERVKQEVLSSSKLSPADCLGVYQRSYYARLLTCMREQFPALCYALGSSVFNAFAREYLLEFPSNTYTLYDLGRRFPGYLRDTRPDRDLPPEERENWVDFMIDLADFERQVFSMFDAPGDEGNLVEDLSIPDDELILQRCFKIHQAKFPVARYYCLVRDGKKPKLPPMLSSQIAMVRVNYRTRLVPLTHPQYQFLHALKTREDISSALAATDGIKLNTNNIRMAWSAPDGWRTQWISSGFYIRSGKVTERKR